MDWSAFHENTFCLFTERVYFALDEGEFRAQQGLCGSLQTSREARAIPRQGSKQKSRESGAYWEQHQVGDSNEASRGKESKGWFFRILLLIGLTLFQDNKELLAKAIKRKDKVKTKRKKKWGERVQKVEQDKQKRQLKREGNIAKRRDEKVKKKLERMRKKGRLVWFV